MSWRCARLLEYAARRTTARSDEACLVDRRGAYRNEAEDMGHALPFGNPMLTGSASRSA